MDKEKKSKKIIQGDNFVMYNDVIIPASPEQQFMNEDLHAMVGEDNTKEEVKLDNKVDSYYDGFK